MDRRAHCLYAQGNQRIVDVVERIAEWRSEHHGAGRSGLVMVVHHLRIPIPVHDPGHILGFRLGHHIGIAVVVVTDVLLVQSRNPAAPAFRRLRFPHVPVRYEFHAVRIGVCREEDVVVEEPHGLTVVAAHHLIDRLHELMGSQHLGGMQSAVDPHYRLAFPGKLSRLVVRQPFGQRQPAGDLLVPGQVPVVLRRGDDRHQMRPSFRGLADLHQNHSGGLTFELPPVLG